MFRRRLSPPARPERTPPITSLWRATPALMIAVAFLLMPGAASAHHPEVLSVAFSCRDAEWAQLDYTVISWAGNGADPTNDPSRANPSIEVLAAPDGGQFQTIGSGAFVAPSYQFSGQVIGPSNLQFHLRVRATAPWGNGRTDASSRTVFLSAPDCSSTATPTPTPTASASPTPVPSPTSTPLAGPPSTATPTATPSSTPAPTATATPTPTASPTPVATASPTPTPSASPTPVATASPTPGPTASPTPTATATASPTPDPTASSTPAPTTTPTVPLAGPPPTSGTPATSVPVPSITPSATPTATPEVPPIGDTPGGPTAGPPSDTPQPAIAGSGVGYAGRGAASPAWFVLLGVALIGTRVLTRAGVHRASALPEDVRLSRPWPPAR